MKIFVSYSRRDADFAQQIDDYFQDSGHDVFTDVKNIQAGVVWTSAIENNISECDIFVVIITHASLRSTEVEKEILLAQRQNKKIIPCIHKDISYDEIKWNLQSIQGVEFQDKYELSRNLYSKISDKKKKPSSSSRQREAAPFIDIQENSQYIERKNSETVFKPKKGSSVKYIIILVIIVIAVLILLYVLSQIVASSNTFDSHFLLNALINNNNHDSRFFIFHSYGYMLKQNLLQTEGKYFDRINDLN